MPSNKEILLSSFCEMNTSMLDLLLKETINEDDLSKETMIKKLEELFAEFRKRGDTELIPYRGCCVSCECERKGRGGYLFVGNNSKHHSSFVIKESDTDWDEYFFCNDFKTDTYVDGLEDEIRITCYKDEQKDFVPSPYYSVVSRLCENAYNELLKEEINYFNKEDCLHWLQQNKVLYNTIEKGYSEYKHFNRFIEAYIKIQRLTEYQQWESLASEALQEYNRIDKVNEKPLLSWIVKYEELGFYRLSSVVQDCLANEVEKISGYFPLDEKKRIFLPLSEYETVIAFKEVFDEYYWDLID